MDLTPVFNQALAAHNARPVEPYVFRLQDLDEFLKEAYRIRAHIAELHTYLRSIRQSYLSTANPPRRKHTARPNNGSTAGSLPKDSQYLTDAQRSEIDASAKQLLRELNQAITGLQDAEQVRQAAESAVAMKKRAKAGLGALGRWAAGGAITAKSPEEELAEAKANALNAHHESIIWYLQRALEECGRFQSSMMEIRITREVEKSKSVLYKARGTMPTTNNDYGSLNGAAGAEFRGKDAVGLDENSNATVEQQLDPEQLQLFAQENQDLLKHYEDHLDAVRTAEKSLLEISELQTQLANNLSMQSAHIDQLVEDSFNTTENVGHGNKELKRATERRSTARLVFWFTCAFCTTLVVWDLII
ncbi:snare protein syntaxin-like protein 18/UFE1 [Corynespora cassiicola Philippines]|uniref:Snare protein syntaxin-like protein 18/UFE1 n=1 Tax=Corynespora cassiicola Philippines TaxID=1448308 RepID=A0A2T2NV31_CORCC|nr:snare protein syntaxin-like protein 18/UFE1 [Corynespora cassiicola Philippines]